MMCVFLGTRRKCMIMALWGYLWASFLRRYSLRDGEVGTKAVA